MAILVDPCPTCGAKGEEYCIKGEIDSDRWQFKEPLGEMHDLRKGISEAERTEIRRAEIQPPYNVWG